MVDETTDGDTYGNGTNADARDGGRSAGAQSVDWLTVSALRAGLALVGLVLLLFAIGRVVGVNLLDTVIDALSTQVGRWIVVALFALVLIVVALRGFGSSAE